MWYLNSNLTLLTLLFSLSSHRIPTERTKKRLRGTPIGQVFRKERSVLPLTRYHFVLKIHVSQFPLSSLLPDDTLNIERTSLSSPDSGSPRLSV